MFSTAVISGCRNPRIGEEIKHWAAVDAFDRVSVCGPCGQQGPAGGFMGVEHHVVNIGYRTN